MANVFCRSRCAPKKYMLFVVYVSVVLVVTVQYGANILYRRAPTNGSSPSDSAYTRYDVKQFLRQHLLSFSSRHLMNLTGALANDSAYTVDDELTARTQSHDVITSSAGADNNAAASVHNQTLLTMFTTFKNDASRFVIHNNTLHNWSALRPRVVPVLYTVDTDPRLVRTAKRLGWLVLPAPDVNRYQTPFLRQMYQTASQRVDSVFYGYSNGDIMYDDSLVRTLEAVVSSESRGHFLNKNQTLVVGKRTNFRVRNRAIYRLEDVSAFARTEGDQFLLTSSDYFFIERNRFPWQQLPPIVIGRADIDLFLVPFASQNGVLIVDATKTLTALHQTGRDGNRAWRRNNVTQDRDYNKNVLANVTYKRGWGLSDYAVETTFSRDNTNVVLSHKWTEFFHIGMILSQL